VAWQVVSATGAVGSQALASASSTALAIASNAGALAAATAGTLEAWAAGIATAVIAGVVLGTVVGRSHLAEASTEVLVRMMRPLPSLALIPIAILVAGLGLKMTAGLVAFTSFWPVFINTRYGVRQVDNLVIDTARTLDFHGLGLVYRVILPAATPLIASGIQVAISLALVVTVSVELVGGTGGIGSFVLQAQQSGAVPAMYAGIVVGGAIGWVLNVGYSVAVRRLLPWRDRTEVTG
jgi:NitT/TauT family transport system permease protein